MPISRKQLQVMAFPFTNYDALIADGAIRSGKTVFMMLAFVDDAMRRFTNQRFGICGKTVDSTVKNIITEYLKIVWVHERYDVQWRKSDKLLIVQSRADGRTNIFEVFGGKDEASFMLIQGRTLAGVLLDEVALQPRSFVEQALARCSVDGSKYWFNCNPDSPNHWFYKEWVLQPEKHNALHLHFELEDNPSLTEKIINRYKTQYSGVFYERYILGLWVRAEGIIFPNFANDPTPWIVPKDALPPRFRWCEGGFDIGGNGSAYANTCSALGSDGVYYVLKSKKTQATDQDMADLERLEQSFFDEVQTKFRQRASIINCDHVAVVVNSINDHTAYRADLCYKPPLEDRPFAISKLLAEHRIAFVEGECDDLIDELRNLVFDDKSERAIPLDDGSMQIDTWDSFIYSLSGNWNYINE